MDQLHVGQPTLFFFSFLEGWSEVFLEHGFLWAKAKGFWPSHVPNLWDVDFKVCPPCFWVNVCFPLELKW